MKDVMKSHDNIACFGPRNRGNAVIANWQLPISDWCLAIGPIGNRQSKIGNVGNLMSDSETPTPEFSDLDETWATELRDAETRARAAGRADISEYLALRRSNDALRRTACDWLLESFRNLAGEVNRAGASLQISNDDNYHFTVANTALTGKLLKLENGIRQLLIEVGWPRGPRDGFIRGGGIALGRLRHLGIKSASDQIRLVTSAEGSPRWMVENKSDDAEIREANIRAHLAVLLDNSRVEELR
jgi:hypothetical protein